MKKALTFFNTLKYLKFSQVYGQVRKRVLAVVCDPTSFEAGLSGEFPGVAWDDGGAFIEPGMQINAAESILEGSFSFIGDKANVSFPPGWDCPDMSRLWRYNLHYMEWIWALSYGDAKGAVLDWIENHKLARGASGWEPYPISLRLMNICGVFFGKFKTDTLADQEFCDRLWGSIFLQAQWLSANLETHLGGNHLFENGSTLAFVGSCFAGGVGDEWFKRGVDILNEEIPEQILNDGTHFELSPMYHCRVTYLLALLFNTGHPQLADLTGKPLKRMVDALRHLTHPDGQIALLNDSAFGIYNTPAQLISYVWDFFEIDNAGAGNFALPKAGYYGFRDDNGTYVICDAGRIGPDYIPGHAHADMFSFELSLKGHRVIVDSGVCDYEISRMRQYCRSTKAHNTLEINGQDQCEMWAAFRVARRGRPHDIKWVPDENGFQLSGWHDGYKRLKGSPVHYREFKWNCSGKLTVKDETAASKPQSIISRLHLHPNCKIERINDSDVLVNYPGGNFKITFFGNGKLAIEDSYYCPQFGVKIANKALAFSFSGNKTETGFQFEML